MANDRWRGFVLSVPILLLAGTGPLSAQVAPMPPAEPAHNGSNAGDNASKQEEGIRQTDSQPAIRDETVGFGGSIDRSQRDNESIDRAPRDIREPFDE